MQDSGGFGRRRQSDDGQQHGTGKTGKAGNLARAKAELRILVVGARIAIGKGGNAKGPGMGPHVNTIGQQRHRSTDHPGRDLSDHESQIEHNCHGKGYAARLDHFTMAVMMVMMGAAHPRACRTGGCWQQVCAGSLAAPLA